MAKNHVRKLIVLINIFYAASMFFSLEGAGSFRQISLYGNENNTAIILPYKEGAYTTKKSKKHLSTLARFIHVLESGIMPESKSFKIVMLASPQEEPTSPLIEPLNFSSHIKLLLATSKHKALTLPPQHITQLLGTEGGKDETMLDVGKFSAILYLVNEASLGYVQTALSTAQYKQYTQDTSLHAIPELAYLLLHEMNYTQGTNLAKPCSSKGCKLRSTAPCEKCNRFWYCSSDCKGYKSHIHNCKGLFLNNEIYPELKEGSKSTPVTPLSQKKRKKTTEGLKERSTTPSAHKEKRSKGHQTYYRCTACKMFTDTRVECQSCELTFYCSPACQEKDLSKHRKYCEGLRCIHCKNLCDKILQCSQCKQAVYCSSKCQKIHWKDGHKKACLASVISMGELN